MHFNTLTSVFDVVIHLAALVHQPNHSDIDAYMNMNYEVTIALAKACFVNTIKQFIALSTSHVYEGSSNDFIQSGSLSPISSYTQYKYKATKKLVRS